MLFILTPGLGAGSVSITEIFKSGKVIEDSDFCVYLEECISRNMRKSRIFSFLPLFSSLPCTDIYIQSKASANILQECREVSSLGNLLVWFTVFPPISIDIKQVFVKHQYPFLLKQTLSNLREGFLTWKKECTWNL